MKGLGTIITGVGMGLALAAAPAFGDSVNEDEITYQEALDKCSEFVNDPQLVTIEFKVSCFDEKVDWLETDRQDISQEGEGFRGHRLIMKEKWSTPDYVLPLEVSPAISQCPILTQFRTSRQADLVLSCEDFVEFYGDAKALADRCDEVLADATPQTEPTGRQANPCAATTTDTL